MKIKLRIVMDQFSFYKKKKKKKNKKKNKMKHLYLL